MSTQSLLTQALYKKGPALPTKLQLYQEKGDVACSLFVWDGTAVFEEACVLSQIIALTAYSEYLIGTASTEDDASSEPASSVLEHRILLYFLDFFSFLVDVVHHNVTKDIVWRKEKRNPQKYHMYNNNNNNKKG